MTQNNYALITGASSGIGLELAKIFAAHGTPLVLTARREELLKALQTDIQNQYKVPVQIITKDLSRPGAAKELYIEIRDKGWEVSTLVNNAGFGLYGHFSETELSKELDMLQLNILALTELTKLFLGPMLQKKSGKILNLASTAAFQPGPVMACYYASKAYVLSFSEALSNELKGTGVSVSALCPGPTESEFQAKADINMNIGLFKASGMMTSAAVAKAGYEGLMKGKRVIVPGLINKITPLGMRFFPRAFVTAIVRRLQDSRKNTR